MGLLVQELGSSVVSESRRELVRRLAASVGSRVPAARGGVVRAGRAARAQLCSPSTGTGAGVRPGAVAVPPDVLGAGRPRATRLSHHCRPAGGGVGVGNRAGRLHGRVSGVRRLGGGREPPGHRRAGDPAHSARAGHVPSGVVCRGAARLGPGREDRAGLRQLLLVMMVLVLRLLLVLLVLLQVLLLLQGLGLPRPGWRTVPTRRAVIGQGLQQ
mmetsp:Transcript_13855/g.52729  ORF Transcript_13855/g.52729 Transcript_13855/m.52729 type:complete len:214 (-) Transcript_13855:1886-2527(-)